MGEDINNTVKWSKFVRKLINQTDSDSITWKDCSRLASRPEATGPIYIAHDVGEGSVAIYRSEYRYYVDEDVFEMRPNVIIEIVDSGCKRQWTVPGVSERYDLIDLVEYKVANVSSILDSFLNDEDGD